MYSKSPSRNNRSKGIKVKHILQVCLLVAVCFWLIYQVKHSREKTLEFDEKDAKLASNTETGNEILRLGRKDISRVADSGIEDKLNEEEDEENEVVQAENRHEDDEQETEEIRTEDKEEEDAGKAGEDDEIEKSGEEKTEEEEETVDEEKDKEESDEKSEDNDDGEKEDNEESEALLDDQDHEGGGRNTQQEREEHYKADDASSEVAHDTNIISESTENATLKHINGSSELIIDGKENISQSSNHSLLEENSQESIEGTNSSDPRVSESMEHKENLTVSVNSSSENSTDLTKLSDNAQVTNNVTQLEPQQITNITQAQNATSEDNHKEDSSQLDNTASTNSTELPNTLLGESLNSSSEVKLEVAKNITGSTETKEDDVKSADSGTIQNPITNSEINVTGEENESSANDNVVGADVHEHDDEFTSLLTADEKESRTDPGTLPDIKVEVQNTDDVEAE